MMFWPIVTLTAEQVYWLKFGIIALIDVAAIYWIWKQVKKVDDQNEVSEKHKQELRAEIQAARTPSAVFDLPRNKERGFQERARRAEELGFREEDSGPWVA